jgi:hypothetical protein
MSRDKEAAADAEGPPALQADLDAGLRFVHRATAATARELRALRGLRGELDALVEELAARGLVDRARLAARVEAPAGEPVLQETALEVGESVDKYGLGDLPQIPCAELIPLCKARCCRLHFALSYQDLDEGVVRWDYERPYRIRRRKDGDCHHLGAGGACQIYAQRPAPCRRFDCRKDPRIWLDYEARVPAPDDDRPLTVG